MSCRVGAWIAPGVPLRPQKRFSCVENRQLDPFVYAAVHGFSMVFVQHSAFDALENYLLDLI